MGIIEALFISDGITKQTILRLDLSGSSTSDKLVNEVMRFYPLNLLERYLFRMPKYYPHRRTMLDSIGIVLKKANGDIIKKSYHSMKSFTSEGSDFLFRVPTIIVTYD